MELSLFFSKLKSIEGISLVEGIIKNKCRNHVKVARSRIELASGLVVMTVKAGLSRYALGAIANSTRATVSLVMPIFPRAIFVTESTNP